MQRSLLSSTVLLIIFAAQAFAEPAGGKGPGPIVTAEWLKEHIGHKHLVLLHVGRKAGFDEQHIPGAQYISTREVSTTREENKLILELPPVERLVRRFESLGISNDSRVVIYWGKDWVTPSTRIFFTLDYLGLADRVSILDGGMPAWIKSGGAVTGKVTQPAAGKLKVSARNLVALQSELVDAILNNKPISIIDARSPKYYTGADKGAMPRAGHIPNAQNIPYSSFVDAENRFKSKDALQKLFDEAGVRKDREVVTYCHIGQQASLAYFAARLLGYKVRIYDGSFQEWSNSKERVVTEIKK